MQCTDAVVLEKQDQPRRICAFCGGNTSCVDISSRYLLQSIAMRDGACDGGCVRADRQAPRMSLAGELPVRCALLQPRFLQSKTICGVESFLT